MTTNANQPAFPLDGQNAPIGLTKLEYITTHYICDAEDKDKYTSQWREKHGTENSPTPQQLQVFIAKQLIAELEKGAK